MAMSRKHYREVADILSHAEHVYGELPGNLAVTHIASQLAGFFARDNSNFNKDRFLDACRPPVQE